MTVYSKRLGDAQFGPSSVTSILTGAPGVVTVLRDVEVVQEGANPSTLLLFLSGAHPYLLTFRTTANFDHAQWEGRIVIGAGEVIQGQVLPGGSVMGMTICGYELG